MKNQLQQYKTRVSATEAVERKLKSQLSSYHSTYQIELEEMRKKLSDERGLNLVLQDQNTKLKKIISQQNLNHDFDEYKNSILKQLIEKDEQINSLSLQVHELKSHLRQLETKEFENRLKQLERSDYETKSPYYTGTEENFTSIKASARSKSPYYRDKLKDK